LDAETEHRPRLRFDKRQRVRARRAGVTLRRRVATTSGAVALGLVALMFARNADQAQELFAALLRRAPWAPFALTPAMYALIAYITRRFASEARGSGIPQVIEGARHPAALARSPLTSLRTAAYKYLLTLGVLLVGGSVGREGPTVQISAAIMQAAQRLFRIDLTSAVVIAGGAAGVSAAFNTPLAGVAFAIEELAAAFEQRLALLAMAAVMISGLVSLGLAGDYLYFGAMHNVLSWRSALVICPVAGVVGGAAGGLFSAALLNFSTMNWAPLAWARSHFIVFAALCGLFVAGVGFASGDLTWGTGYVTAKAIVEGTSQPLGFGPEKIAVTLMTALSGVPGGIFAPSLSAGAGLGDLIALMFPSEPLGAVAILGMIGYFVGVVRSPLTAVLIVSEMTDSRAMTLPLVATAVIADGVSALVCRERLYHGLARGFRTSPDPRSSSSRTN
jgi:H+/Cl- antiporter ClcA